MSLRVQITHRFDNFTLNAAFDAPAGVTALFGASGSGKTTVVNAVAGLIKPDQARISLNDQMLCDSATRLWLPPHKRRLGYVFQEARLFPHLSVQQNLRYGRWFAGLRGDSAEETRLIALLGLGPLLARRPGALSGGEKQRVAIGRALLSAPELLLMDEPLAALDEARKAEILPYLERLRDETQIPILYVSHAMAEVARLATTVVVLSDGKVLRAGPVQDILSDPGIAPTIGLREAGAVLLAQVVAHHPDGLSELSAAGGRLFLPEVTAQPGRTLRVRILAQDVILSRTRPDGLSALNILPGTVSMIHAGDGPGVLVQLQTGDAQILARITRRSAQALELSESKPFYAIIKSVSVAQDNVGRGA